MPATRAQFHKVGFGPRRSGALTSMGGQTLLTLTKKHGFTTRQAKELLLGVYNAGTNAGGYTLTTLIRRGGFTATQARLILAA